jgi:HSP20 family protein
MAFTIDLCADESWEVETMLMRTDPFSDFDRLTQQLLSTAARPAVLAMDAWREDDHFIAEFDLPGIAEDSLELAVDRDVLTVRAERRPDADSSREIVSAERPHGVFSRQLLLSENLDTDRIEASYQSGVLRLAIPIAESAKRRPIEIAARDDERALSA